MFAACRRLHGRIARRNGTPAELFYASTLEPAPAQLPYFDTSKYPAFTSDIYPVFRELFAKKTGAEAAAE